MRNAPVLAFLIAFPVVGLSPEEITGTWEAVGVHFAPWTFTFRSDGTKLTGTVRQASFDRPTRVGTSLSKPVEIYDGTISGDTISFRCDSPGRHEQRTITFTGSVDGDKILFTRSIKVFRAGNPGLTGIYGARGATQFTATRKPPPQ